MTELHAKRLNPPDGEEQPARWAARVAWSPRLDPTGELVEGPGHLPHRSHAAEPPGSPATTRGPLPFVAGEASAPPALSAATGSRRRVAPPGFRCPAPVACSHVSGAQTRVFIARLAGIAVFDPIGDQVGRVRDVVVALRIGARARRACSGSSSRCPGAGASSCR